MVPAEGLMVPAEGLMVPEEDKERPEKEAIEFAVDARSAQFMNCKKKTDKTVEIAAQFMNCKKKTDKTVEIAADRLSEGHKPLHLPLHLPLQFPLPLPLPPLRCFACSKKVGLRGFKCRCGDTFCPAHRHSDTHDCPFDYKAAGKASIAKANPIIKAEKLYKI